MGTHHLEPVANLFCRSAVFPYPKRPFPARGEGAGENRSALLFAAGGKAARRLAHQTPISWRLRSPEGTFFRVKRRLSSRRENRGHALLPGKDEYQSRPGSATINHTANINSPHAAQAGMLGLLPRRKKSVPPSSPQNQLAESEVGIRSGDGRRPSQTMDL